MNTSSQLEGCGGDISTLSILEQLSFGAYSVLIVLWLSFSAAHNRTRHSFDSLSGVSVYHSLLIYESMNDEEGSNMYLS